MRHWRRAELETQRASKKRPYLEFLRVEAMSAGVYVLPAGAIDEQQPHGEDEVYVVLAGAARFTADDQTIEVDTGDTIFVPAGEHHRFHDVAQELVLAVIFAPPEGGAGRS